MSLDFLGLQKTSFIDYPGLISAVVFTHGCNMACGYCHNGVLVRGPTPRDFLSRWAVLDELSRRRHLVAGVVITGGEPLIHPDLLELIGEIKSLGLKVKLDTNGTLPDRLREILPTVDYVAMDLKAPLDRYQLFGYSGDPQVIQQSISLLRCSDTPHEFRLVWIPGIHSLEMIPSMAETLGPGAPLFLTAFRPGYCLDPDFNLLPRPTSPVLLEAVQGFRDHGIDAHLRG